MTWTVSSVRAFIRRPLSTPSSQATRAIQVNRLLDAAHAVVEQLENRTLLSASLITTPLPGTLWIDGTNQADTIIVGVAADTSQVSVNLNGNVQQFDKASIHYIRINAFAGNDVIRVDETYGRLPVGINVAAGQGSDRIQGSSWGDNIWGDKGNDYIVGNGGDDRLYGMKGDDRIWGGLGNDRIEGNGGNDTIDAGWGADAVWGNDGNDLITTGENPGDYVIGGRGVNNINDAKSKAFVSFADRGDTSFNNEAAPAGVIATPLGYTVPQIRTAYNFDALASNIDGNGQAIAVVIAYNVPNAAADLQTFSDYYGLANPDFEVVYTSGTAPIDDPNGDNGWATEANLDLQWSHAIAPRAKLYLVLADSNNFGDINAAIDKAAATVTNNFGGGVVNMSLGAYTEAGYNFTEAIFANPAYRNVSFVAASGDQGAVISYPGTSPNVLSVGGTALFLDGAGNRTAPEAAWQNASAGYSGVFDTPAYQLDLTVNGGPGLPFRVMPDVSYNSAPATAVSIYTSFAAVDENGDNIPDSGWVSVGGTSAAAPQWSGIAALANQVRNDNSLGFLGAGLTAKTYALGTINQDQYYYDTQVGGVGFPILYDASPGYDVATGWGTPKADQIVAGLSDGATIGVGIRGFDWHAEYIEALSKYPGGIPGPGFADFKGDGDARIGFTAASLAFRVNQEYNGNLLQITVPSLTRNPDGTVYGLGSATVVGPITSNFFTISVAGAISNDSRTGEVQIRGTFDGLDPITGEPPVSGLQERFFGSFSTIQ